MTQLTPEIAQAIQARIRYYRDLGIHDFYRRGEPVPESEIEIVTVTNREPEPPIPARKPTPPPLFPTALVESIPAGDRAAALQAIREDIGDCTRCPLAFQGRHTIVFGDGDPNARLMFIGEGPGADEDAHGLPFVGRAGQLLNNMIAATGLKREQVYIANVVKCRPPGNRTPERDECDTCSPFLMRQIQVIRPKIIVALGATAAKNLLGVNDSMMSMRGRFYDFSPPRTVSDTGEPFECKLAVTYHPAFLLHDPRQKKETWKDLQMGMRELGLPMPTRSSEQE